VKPFPLLLGKTLAMSFVGLLQLSLWLGTVYIIGNLAAARIIDLSNLSVEPDMLLVSLVYFLLGFGFVGGMYASIASLVNTTREGSQVAGFVVMPLVVPLFFVNVFVQDPNGTLARILSLIPITAPLAMVMRSAISNVPPAELALSILLMAALVMGSIWLAARLFRVNSLLRGTMPKFRDIPKLLFERS
jgi:ABC-2 type transport system permease protein